MLIIISVTRVKRNFKHFYETGLPYCQGILHQYLFNLNMVVVRIKQNNIIIRLSTVYEET